MNRKKVRAWLQDVWTLAIVGAQWGDEAKGKLIDVFSLLVGDCDARGTGGANAGHTVVVGANEYKFSQLPAGMLHDQKGVITISGGGMVIDPRRLIQELDGLDQEGLTHRHFHLSHRASLILPQHLLLDMLREKQSGAGKIGTTNRGIGPAYTDRTGRIGLVVNDLLNPDIFRSKLERNLREKTLLLARWDREDLLTVMEKSGVLGAFYDPERGFDVNQIVSTYLEYGQVLSPYIMDTDRLMRAVVGKKRLLLEGAQAIHLGIDTGSIPFVTSSDSTVHGLAKGVGLRERDVDLTVLVAKLIMTRVGGGPFPTEFGGSLSEDYCNNGRNTPETEAKRYPNPDVNCADELEQGIAFRQLGREFGTVSGRLRRTGWLDLVLLKDAIRHSRPCVLALTKVDRLDTCRKIKLCVGYTYTGPDTRIGETKLTSGDELAEAFLEAEILSYCRPIYRELDGWCSPSNVGDSNSLPSRLKDLIKFVEEFTGTEVKILSVGPDRDQTILLD